jgi:hypothetical protein
MYLLRARHIGETQKSGHNMDGKCTIEKMNIHNALPLKANKVDVLASLQFSHLDELAMHPT